MRFCRRNSLTLNLVCWLSLLAAGALAEIDPLGARAEIVTLKNGYQLEGSVGRIAAIAENPLAPSSPDDVKAENIVLIDDQLRRTFVPMWMFQGVAQPPVEQARRQSIAIPQRVAQSGSRITSVGVPLSVTPFDKFGRRVYSMQTAKGPIHVVQGITKVTPNYTVLNALVAKESYIWETKVATSSIPRETLSEILRHAAGKDETKRRQIVFLYVQSERYADAAAELEACMKDFPDSTDFKDQVASLRQANAERLLKEIDLRRDAGQHQLAIGMATGFPIEGIAGETRIKVREVLTSYDALKKQGEQVLKLFEKHVEELPQDRHKDQVIPIFEEITRDLSPHNLERFADYLRLSDADDLKADQKLALAISGWLLGNGEGIENLSLAISLFEVRNLVRDYLRSETANDRADILNTLASTEGSSPTNVSKLLKQMKPALETPVDEALPAGMYKLRVKGLTGEAEMEYLIQLPPEYNPYRRYPVVVTLHGAATTAEQQINWWAGDYNAERQMRLGQASRRGCVVIAPLWTEDRQASYKYSAREHAAVLFSVRDALARFSIDTDRVFISGHSMGGDAAWDIALAHPDMWAGVVLIGAMADRYTTFYADNGKQTPLYFVAGEFDGDRFSKCSTVLDRHLARSGFDAVVVQYQQRGHEHFYEEIQNIFGWMELHKRDALPKQFKCISQRPWDNYYYWVEVENYPQNLMTLPESWPPKGGAKATTEAEVKHATSIFVSSSATRATVYLTPEIIDFESKFTIRFNAKSYPMTVQPSVAVMLEDARTRSDRQHPFWQKVVVGK